MHEVRYDTPCADRYKLEKAEPQETDAVDDFIARWAASGGAEGSNDQLFIAELCDLLGVARSDLAQPDNAANAYVFERSATAVDGEGRQTTNYVDCYKQGSFVCETKQGIDSEGVTDPVDRASTSLNAGSKSPGRRTQTRPR